MYHFSERKNNSHLFLFFIHHTLYTYNRTLTKVYKRLITGKKNKQKFLKQKALMKFVRALL